MRCAFDLVAPNIPAFGRLTGKKLYAGKVSHEPDNAFPRFIRLFGMLFDVAEDDLTHTGVNTLRMSLRSKDADFGVCPCPIPHAGEEVIVLAVLLATVYKGNIIKNLIMDCQSYTKYRPNETTGGIFVSWRRKEELPTGA